MIAADLLSSLERRWVSGKGFAFKTDVEPGLQGTEMWLSITWLSAKLLGKEELLSFKPKGVHSFVPRRR